MTPDATSKTHFVIVDAIGVTESALNDTKPLERNRTVALRSLLQSVAVGQLTPDIVSSVASRLARLDRQITREDRDELESLAGISLAELTHALVEAADLDCHSRGGSAIDNRKRRAFRGQRWSGQPGP